MSRLVEQIGVHARIQLLRHLRSPAIWWLALAAPIGARFLVPDQSASYSVLAVNDARLSLDSGVIGLQLGVVMAIILSPLAYIFLRAGPTRKTPWQAENVTPARRTALGLGHWIADTAALWLLMLSLAVAGVILAYFRLPAEKVNPIQIILALSLIAAPALAVIAALRTIFSMRPWLRKAGGDILFFVIWMGFIILSAAFFAGGGQGGSPFVDVFGFAAPLAGATEYEISELYIGGAPVFENQLEIDAMKGVTDPAFLLSRLFWVSAAGILVFLSGFVFKPSKIGVSFKGPQTDHAPRIFATERVSAIQSTSHALPAKLLSEAIQILRPNWFVGLLGVVSLAGLILPFRGMIGPAISLLLIFPLTQHGARWRGSEMSRLTDLSPTSAGGQLLLRLAASVGLLFLLCLPSMVQMVFVREFYQLSDIAAISIGLPLIAIGLGHFTRGPVAGRLILLILWYGYLNIGPAPLG